MQKMIYRLSLAAVLLLVGAILARADSIGPSCASTPGGSTTGDPGGCGGDIYTLTLVSYNSSTNTYVVRLQDETSGFSGTTKPGYVLDVALQLNISGGSTVSNTEANLISAPGGTADWTSVLTGGTNSNGCDQKGNFFCVQLLSSVQGASAPDQTGSASPYAWTFDVTLPTGETLDPSSFGDAIKVVYYTADINNRFDGVQTGAPITLQPTPEPISALLYGTGLVGILLRLRRARS